MLFWSNMLITVRPRGAPSLIRSGFMPSVRCVLAVLYEGLSVRRDLLTDGLIGGGGGEIPPCMSLRNLRVHVQGLFGLVELTREQKEHGNGLTELVCRRQREVDTGTTLNQMNMGMERTALRCRRTGRSGMTILVH